MSNKKLIPCRVCGKLFEPCSYCQSHADIFRWRNFACSRECATTYINDTIAYRESLKHNKKENSGTIEEAKKTDTETATTKSQRKRKYSRKVSVEAVENEIENNETE